LGLPVYHILEEEIKRQVDPDVYARNVGMMELALDTPAIVQRVQTSRSVGGERP
jgi:betaine reductase